MIPNIINSAAPSPFPPVVDPREDQDQLDHHHQHQHLLHHQLLLPPNYQTPSSSSSSVSYSVFFNSPHQDQPDHHYFHIDQMHHEQPQREDALVHVPYAGSHDPEKKPNKGLKISLWKNTENDHGDQENPVKWMSSKMRLMQKMKKKPDIVAKPEDQKPQQHPPASSSLETNHFGCNSSSNNTNSTPFRVCADCNTTKTPLWRSGPKGPRSLCNACGIRQRKARRAMAAAAATANGSSQHFETTAAPVKMKVQNNEKMKNNIGQTTPFKKRSKMMAAAKASSHAQQQKKDNVFEDFLVKLSQNLTFHRVFPQDEKEAAILLMALSCGLVHG